MDRIHLQLFGGFQARGPAGPIPSLPLKAQALLAYLAVRPGQSHPRDKLAALLWGDTGDAQARDSLRHTLAALRKALEAVGRTVLISERQGCALDPDAIEVDVVEFERRVAAPTPEALEEVAPYQGDLLEGLAVSEPRFEEWLLAERERRHELALEALAKLLAHYSQAGASDRAVATASRLLSLDPLQEVVHRALMRLHARQGRRGAALKQYQVCVSVLHRELRAEPEPKTKQLYQEILRRDSGEGGKAGAPLAEATRAVRGGAADLPAEITLHGRETERRILRQAFEDATKGHGRVVMLVGDAGIGKTSLIAATAASASASTSSTTACDRSPSPGSSRRSDARSTPPSEGRSRRWPPEIWLRVTSGRLQEGVKVLLDHAVQHGMLGVAWPVVAGAERHSGDIGAGRK